MLRSDTPGSSFPTKSPASLRALLIGSSVAGLASLGLGATPAHALSTPCSFGGGAGTPCQLNTPYDSTAPSDKQITFLQGPTAGMGDIEFEWIPVTPLPGYLSDIWKIDVDFTPALQGPVTGVFDYEINIFEGPMQFNTVELSVDAVAGTPTVTKSIYGDAGFTQLLQQITVSGNATSGYLALPSDYTTLYVRDSYVLKDGDILDNFQNNFTQVPGPLPLLGAGTAFGFSRRLRRRVRQRHSLG